MAALFLDTNVLVYAFSTDPRGAVAEELLRAEFVVGVQGLNEFANVARRKLGMDWPQTREALAAIRTLAASVQPLDAGTHDMALDIAERHRLSFYDALMTAAAVQAGCAIFCSEDLQDGFVVANRLRVENPFAIRE